MIPGPEQLVPHLITKKLYIKANPRLVINSQNFKAIIISRINTTNRIKTYRKRIFQFRFELVNVKKCGYLLFVIKMKHLKKLPNFWSKILNALKMDGSGPVDGVQITALLLPILSDF